MKREIYLSLSDLLQAIRRGRIFFYISALLFGTLAFMYAVTRPISFTVEGIFKGQSSASENSLHKALEFLGGDESYLNSEDPKVILRSYPVLENVVKALDLQATLPSKREGRLKQVWYQLKTLRAYGYVKRHPPQASIFSRSEPVAVRAILPENPAPFFCSAVAYQGEVLLNLNILFHNEKEFSVYAGRNLLGEGATERPFIWPEGSFIFHGIGTKGQTLPLTLMPLKEITLSLKKTIKITKDKDSPTLIHVCMRHRDRHLAARIVNETMAQYQCYLQEEGRKKIDKQLSYLNSRKEETLHNLDDCLQQYTQFLTSSLSAQHMLSLETEMQLLTQKQGEKRQALLDVRAEIESLAQILWEKKPKTFAEIIALFTASYEEEKQLLSIESARPIIQKRQEELDRFCLDHARYNFCLEKLQENSFDAAALAKMLQEPSLNERFDKIHAIHRKLVDRVNWSEKEKERLKEELETEKLFLQQHILALKEGGQLHERLLRTQLRKLQENLICLLAERYQQIEHGLALLNGEAAIFPQKWLAEQKISLQAKLSTEIMESIAKMIEVKNIGYHMDYLMASPLQQGSPPLFPNHPHLIAKTFLGSLIGIFFTFVGTLFYLAAQGPSASFANLSSLGWRVVPDNETIAHVGSSLRKEEKIVAIAAKKSGNQPLLLKEWLTAKGEKVIFLSLDGVEDYYLCSASFHEQLEAWQEAYDRILLIYQGSPQRAIFKTLAQYSHIILYGITNEKLEDVAAYAHKTIFFQQKEIIKAFNLRHIQSLLDRLIVGSVKNLTTKKQKPSYFSGMRSFLEHFLLKKP